MKRCSKILLLCSPLKNLRMADRVRSGWMLVMILCLFFTRGGSCQGQDATAAQNQNRSEPDQWTVRVVDASDQQPISAFRAIAGVPSSVSKGFEKEHEVQVINWQSHQLRDGANGTLHWPLERAYPEMALRVEADGYVPKLLYGIKKAEGAKEFSCALAKDSGISGSVMTPGGSRAAHDATVVLAMIRRNVRLVGSTFPELALPPLPANATPRQKWDRPIVVQPDEQGRFRLPTEPDPTAVVLFLHGDGAMVLPYAQWKQSPDVILEPWGRIHGRIRWGNVMPSEEQVDLIINRGDQYGYPDIVSQSDRTTTDSSGRFVFERVLPGLVQLSVPFETTTTDGSKQTNYFHFQTTHAEIKSPHTSVLLGGQGRRVTGRLTGRDDYSGITFHFHPEAPHIGFRGDQQQWVAWSAVQQSAIGSEFFRNQLKVNSDGTFAMEHVLPGHYQIFFSEQDGKSRVANSSFRIAAEDNVNDPLPMAHDLGAIKTANP